MSATTAITFKTYDGLLLSGSLYDAGKARPTIIMTNGFSGLKDNFLTDHASAFHDAGYTVLFYDNRCWGDSEGQPRNEVDPPKQARDYFDAFAYAQTLPCVDPENIFYWGASMGGGNALIASAVNKKIRGVIVEVPYVTAGQWPSELAAHLIADRASHQQEDPTVLPIWPESIEAIKNGSSKALLSTVESLEFEQTLRRLGHPYEAGATLQSLLNCMVHEPMAFIHRISPVPLLFVSAAKDNTSPYEAQMRAFALAQEPKKLHVFEECGHYDLYSGEPMKQNIAFQITWLQDVLSGR